MLYSATFINSVCQLWELAVAAVAPRRAVAVTRVPIDRTGGET